MATFNPLTGVDFSDSMDMPSYEEMMKPYEHYKTQYDKDENLRDAAQEGLAQYLPYIGQSGQAYDEYQGLQKQIDNLSKYIGTPYYQSNRNLFTKLKKNYSEKVSMMKNAKELWDEYNKNLKSEQAKDPTNFYRAGYTDPVTGRVNYADNIDLNTFWGNRNVDLYRVSGNDTEKAGQSFGAALSNRAARMTANSYLVTDKEKQAVLDALGNAQYVTSSNKESGVPNGVKIDWLFDPVAHRADFDRWCMKNGIQGERKRWLYDNLLNGDLGQQMRNHFAGTSFDHMTDDSKARLVKKFMGGVFTGLKYDVNAQYHLNPQGLGGSGNDVPSVPDVDIINEGVEIKDEDLDHSEYIDDEDDDVVTPEVNAAKERMNSEAIQSIVEATKQKVVQEGEIPSFDDFYNELAEPTGNSDHERLVLRGNGADPNGTRMYSLYKAFSDFVDAKGWDKKEFEITESPYPLPFYTNNFNITKVFDKIQKSIKDGSLTNEEVKSIYDGFINNTAMNDINEATSQYYDGTSHSYSDDFNTINKWNVQKQTLMKEAENLPGSNNREKIEFARDYNNAIRVLNGHSYSLDTALKNSSVKELDGWLKDVTDKLASFVDDHYYALWFNKTLKETNYAPGVYTYNHSDRTITGDEKGISNSEFSELPQHLTDLRVYNGYLTASDDRDATKRYVIIPNNETVKKPLDVANTIDKFVKNTNEVGKNIYEVKPINDGIDDNNKYDTNRVVQNVDAVMYSEEGNRKTANALMKVKNKQRIGDNLYAVNIPYTNIIETADGKKIEKKDSRMVIFSSSNLLMNFSMSDIINGGKEYARQYGQLIATSLHIFKARKENK